MAELMRNDAAGNTGGGGSFVEIRAELADKHVPGSRSSQQAAIRERWVQPAEKAQTMD